jgi:hypothetical protein
MMVAPEAAVQALQDAAGRQWRWCTGSSRQRKASATIPCFALLLFLTICSYI